MITFHFLGRLRPILLPLLSFTSTKPRTSSSSTVVMSMSTSSATPPPPTPSPWIALDREQAVQAKERLEVWPLDEYNAKLLNEVHPIGYVQSDEPHEEYDLVGTNKERTNDCSLKSFEHEPRDNLTHSLTCVNSSLFGNSDWFWSRRFGLQSTKCKKRSQICLDQ